MKKDGCADFRAMRQGMRTILGVEELKQIQQDASSWRGDKVRSKLLLSEKEGLSKIHKMLILPVLFIHCSSIRPARHTEVWDNYSPPWVGWRGRGYREGARSATGRAITTVRTSSRKESGSLVGYAQSPRGASMGATGNGLEANTRAEQPKRTYIGAKGTAASFKLRPQQ